MSQEVSWPPPESQADVKYDYPKTLPKLNEKVHIGRSQRPKMDLELKNFQRSTAHYFSNPFSKCECSANIENIFYMFALRVFSARQDKSRGKMEASTESTGDKQSDRDLSCC